MSNPVANEGIEDVLSSIRRLVSNGPDKGGEETGDMRGADRLVLTPSQRVDDAKGATAEAAHDDRAPAGSAERSEVHPPETEGDAPFFLERGAEVEVFDALPDPEAEAFASDGTEKPDDAESEHDPDLDPSAAMFARHETGAPGARVPRDANQSAVADAAEASAQTSRDAGVGGEALDDASDARDGAGTDRIGDRAAFATAPAPDRDADAPDDEGNAFSIKDETVRDEEALRDLVAESVRQELMGPLGERITRNIRKLVRREIHRALNSHEVD